MDNNVSGNARVFNNDHPCRHCGTSVNLDARLRGWSDLAKWGAESMALTWGVLCDACYEAQERVR